MTQRRAESDRTCLCGRPIFLPTRGWQCERCRQADRRGIALVKGLHFELQRIGVADPARRRFLVGEVLAYQALARAIAFVMQGAGRDPSTWYEPDELDLIERAGAAAGVARDLRRKVRMA